MQEAGSQQTVSLFEPLNKHEKLLSVLSGLEVRSAIRRRQRSGDLSSSDADAALNSLALELQSVEEVPVTAEIIDEARRLLDTYQLRTLDSLQLATATLARQHLRGKAVEFVASDHALLHAAIAEGFKIFNPEMP